jgi:hypothetical protein
MVFPVIPAVPQALYDAASRGALVPFVGAGVSKIAGCPNWDELANLALKYFVDRRVISHADYEHLRFLSAREKISIAIKLQNEDHRLDFRELITPDGYKNDKGRKVYSALCKLSYTFVTTNYDNWLHHTFKTSASSDPAVSPTEKVDPYFDVTDFTSANLSKAGIFHIHGTLQGPQSNMVITARDYLDRYSGDENKLVGFLKHLFKEKVVLFVGYGMGDLEILEHLLIKSANQSTSKHFILQGFFDFQNELVIHMQRYFDQFNVELLPYSRDRSDWDQLIEVLEKFGEKIKPSLPPNIEKIREMKSWIDG